MNVVKIREPIWKTKSVGIAESKITEHNYIEILYEDKNGTKLFPHTYYVSGDKLKSCPTQVVGTRTKVYLVKIDDLEVIPQD